MSLHISMREVHEADILLTHMVKVLNSWDSVLFLVCAFVLSWLVVTQTVILLIVTLLKRHSELIYI